MKMPSGTGEPGLETPPTSEVQQMESSRQDDARLGECSANNPTTLPWGVAAALLQQHRLLQMHSSCTGCHLTQLWGWLT